MRYAPTTAAPPFPEYPSAHACHSGAIAAILKSIVGHDDVDFELDSEVTGQTRTYRYFNDIVNEVSNARIWAGFHYRASTDDGAIMGRRIGRYILHHTFQRTGGEHGLMAVFTRDDVLAIRMARRRRPRSRIGPTSSDRSPRQSELLLPASG
jgi:hypothetical protein